MLHRRGFLVGLFAAAPVVIVSSHLMPLRGVKLDPLVRLQSWVPGSAPSGLWATFQGPLSKLAQSKSDMLETFRVVYDVDPVGPSDEWFGSDPLKDMWRPIPIQGQDGALNLGFKEVSDLADGRKYAIIRRNQSAEEFKKSTDVLIEQWGRQHTFGRTTPTEIYDVPDYPPNPVRQRTRSVI